MSGATLLAELAEELSTPRFSSLPLVVDCLKQEKIGMHRVSRETQADAASAHR
jgi:hypothetical protein